MGLRFAAAVLLTVCGGVVALVAAALESSPALSRQVVLEPDRIGRAKALVDAHRYRVPRGSIGQASIRADDADAAANYLARRFARGSAAVTFRDGSADLRFSMPLDTAPFGAYLNAEATVVDTGAFPAVRALRLGDLAVPDWLTEALSPVALRALHATPEVGAALDSVRTVRIFRESVFVAYHWKGLPDAVRAQVIDDADRERLQSAQAMLRQTVLARGAPPQAELTEILVPLLRHAAGRSASGDAVAENRAALLVAMLHALGKSPKVVLPAAAAWPRPPRQTVTLGGRDDFAKHFLVSAAIAAYADTRLADAIGLYKEVEDARSGSGFSFNDLAADRAGTRFGELAADPATASTLQARVAAGLQTADILPPWRDLPEGLPAAEFERRFGGTGGPAYLAMAAEIERRVAALAVLR